MRVDHVLCEMNVMSTGVLYALTVVNVGASIGVILLAARGQRVALPSLYVAALFVCICVVGCALLPITVQLSHFRGNLVAYHVLGDHSFSILGGILLSIPFGYMYCVRREFDFFEVGSVCCLGLTTFTILQRFVCFLRGCCFGQPTTGNFGWIFPAESEASRVLPGERLHPTQLYSAGSYILAGILIAYLIKRRVAPRTCFGGFVVFIGAERILNEQLRYKQNSEIVLALGDELVTGYAIYGFVLVVLGLYFLVRSPAAASSKVG